MLHEQLLELLARVPTALDIVVDRSVGQATQGQTTKRGMGAEILTVRVMRQSEGVSVNVKRVHRLYCEDGLPSTPTAQTPGVDG